MQRDLPYRIVDVFTDRIFGGNPLAVFDHADGLPSDVMQQIAREMNLSETTFVLPPYRDGSDFALRIFTPRTELPLAGHPTIGTTFVLASSGRIPATRPAIVLDEGVGPIPVTIDWADGMPVHVLMQQPVPAFGEIMTDRDVLAQMLSVSPDAIRSDLPAQVLSNGVRFLYVPMRSLPDCQHIVLRQDIWQQHFAPRGIGQIFAFTTETMQPDATVHSRMFAPAMGIVEDPATGAASGPLGCYLVTYGLVPRAPHISLISEQGIEMERPSRIEIVIEMNDNAMTRVQVGGATVAVSRGVLTLDL